MQIVPPHWNVIQCGLVRSTIACVKADVAPTLPNSVECLYLMWICSSQCGHSDILRKMFSFVQLYFYVFIVLIVSLLVQGFECNLGLRARVNGYKLHEAKPSAIMPFTSAIIPNCTRKHAIVHKPCYKLTVHYNKYEYVWDSQFYDIQVYSILSAKFTFTENCCYVLTSHWPISELLHFLHCCPSNQ